MRANIDLTRGLIFADAAAAALAPALGGDAAHRLVEEAAERVRATGAPLSEALCELLGAAAPEHAQALERAFDLRPAIDAAALWVDRALAAEGAYRQ
jgi:3-carboxy-cis,cis-muconate cycloisomerase